MDNRELKNIIEEIEEKEGLTLKEIAETANLDRSNLSSLINNEEKKEVTGRMIGKIKKHFPVYFKETTQKQHIQHTEQGENSQNESFEHWLTLHLSPQQYITELREDKKRLQNTIDANLTAMMQLLSALSRHDRAFHDTILRSLARLEGKPEVDLVAEARSSEAAKQIEEMTMNSKNETRM